MRQRRTYTYKYVCLGLRDDFKCCTFSRSNRLYMLNDETSTFCLILFTSKHQQQQQQ